MWEERIRALKIWDTGILYHSFINHVMTNSGGDVSKIDFLFKQYGIYVDMGVGRETFRGNEGDISTGVYYNERTRSMRLKREPKPWYSKVFFREVVKLREYMMQEYAYEDVTLIGQAFADAFDQRFTSGGKQTYKRTISSLRTAVYREKTNARTRRNYRRRR